MLSRIFFSTYAKLILVLLFVQTFYKKSKYKILLSNLIYCLNFQVYQKKSNNLEEDVSLKN